MGSRFIKVEGFPNLVRDRETNAIVNINTEEIRKQQLVRNVKKQEAARLDKLESDVTEIKNLLTKIIEKL